MFDFVGSPASMRLPARDRPDASHNSLVHDCLRPESGEQAAACVAHEVNQPLTAIQASAEAALNWLSGDPPNLDEARHAVEDIIRNSGRAADVVRSVRDLVRKNPPDVANCDLNEVVRDTVALADMSLMRHAVRLETELSPKLPPIKGDPVQLGCLLRNLIANAIEAMSAVEGRERVMRITTTLDRPGRVLVTVEDSGPGLDQVGFDNVFQPFFTTKRAGVGLGLCRSIVGSHRGRLWATANVPHGSIFRFVIPTGQQCMSEG